MCGVHTLQHFAVVQADSKSTVQTRRASLRILVHEKCGDMCMIVAIPIKNSAGKHPLISFGYATVISSTILAYCAMPHTDTYTSYSCSIERN